MGHGRTRHLTAPHLPHCVNTGSPLRAARRFLREVRRVPGLRLGRPGRGRQVLLEDLPGRAVAEAAARGVVEPVGEPAEGGAGERLRLLADDVPRTKPAIVEALAGRHDKQDVGHALIRLAVTDRVGETGGRYALAAG